tara:strand:- start:754 stop:1551 length:798 start_codon:yes stop_codon:yes gene_type:complete
MILLNVKSEPIRLSASSKVNTPLMVCSHERSGTHFLMNSLSNYTNYIVKPYLNFDYSPLSSMVNFYSKENINNLIEQLNKIKLNGDILCLNSIIKSHFPISLLGNESIQKLKVVYIYRNPVDVFISYWRFLHRWEWDEGPKVKSPIELSLAKPSGQSQRYQIENYETYFERWGEHVSNAIKESKKSNHIICITFDKLVKNNFKCIQQICNYLSIEITHNHEKEIVKDYIKGNEKLNISNDIKTKLKNHFISEIKKYPEISQDIIN